MQQLLSVGTFIPLSPGFSCTNPFYGTLFNTFNNYQKEINKNSYLSRTIGEVKYEELDNIFTETSDDYFLYISYVDKDKILDLEKGLKKIILKYNIENKLAVYLPNAVDEELFCGLKELPKPKDMITGEKTFLYFFLCS